MIQPFNPWCQPQIPSAFDDSLSYYQVLCKVITKLNECIEGTNDIESSLAEFKGWVTSEFNRINNALLTEYVTHAQMLADYKLDRNGNFTGDIFGIPGYTVQSNRDEIKYLVSQFDNGQTGLIIDGGFFLETDVKASYDGGVF